LTVSQHGAAPLLAEMETAAGGALRVAVLIGLSDDAFAAAMNVSATGAAVLAALGTPGVLG
jgi:hypothetical protein